MSHGNGHCSGLFEQVSYNREGLGAEAQIIDLTSLITFAEMGESPNNNIKEAGKGDTEETSSSPPTEKVCPICAFIEAGPCAEEHKVSSLISKCSWSDQRPDWLAGLGGMQGEGAG